MEHFINIIFDNKEEIDDIVVSVVATMVVALLESETNYSSTEPRERTNNSYCRNTRKIRRRRI